MSTISSRWSRPIIAAVAVIGSIHSLYFIRNAWIDRALVQQETTRLEKELAYDRRKLLSHDLLADQLTVMRPLLATLEQRLPAHLDTSSMEATLREQAAQSKVEITDLHSGAEMVKEGFYAEKPMVLRVQGTTENVFAFLDQLLRASPIRYVREMHVDRSDGSGVTLQLVMIYVHYVSEDE